MGRPPRRTRTAGLAALIAAIAVLAAGCVTVPTSGRVQSVNVTQGRSGGSQYYLQPIPVAPGANWSPAKIVSGFLAANASFASDHAIAREYLTGNASRDWHPPGGEAVIFGQLPTVTTGVAESAPHNRTSYDQANVEVRGPVSGMLSSSGQYSISPQSPAPAQDKFVLVKAGGQWRISNLPDKVLLTEADFQHVYQPRDIYFFDPAMKVLVPDPVYIPQEATASALVTQLMHVMIDEPTGWLLSAAQTGFPAGTKLLSVNVDSGTAIINLAGSAVSASNGTLRQMSAQLLWTLAGSSSDEPSIQSVELEINGSPWTLPGSDSPVQQIGSYSSYVPSVDAHKSFFYTDHNGAVHSLAGSAQANGSQGAAVPGAPGTGNIPLTSIAVSPDGKYVAGYGSSGDLYTGGLGKNSSLTQRATGGFTSLSWDSHDDLWAVGHGHVWMIPARSGSPIQVPDQLKSGVKVTALKIAPDGVRCALLTTGNPGTQLLLAAIVHSGEQAYLGDAVPISSENLQFSALTWYDADHVLALSQPSNGNPLVDEVPVNGETLSQYQAQPGTVSLTADGSSNPIVAGQSNGNITTLASLNGIWSGVVGTGFGPAYPG